ncbi:hypothetical protein HER18_03595 [Chryseobacterium sp. NEB161]|nr:hypothetical protein HER18_03595 [Chryseobacterium sp. NEB161]
MEKKMRRQYQAHKGFFAKNKSVKKIIRPYFLQKNIASHFFSTVEEAFFFSFFFGFFLGFLLKIIGGA